jgi:hypothetical protein
MVRGGDASQDGAKVVRLSNLNNLRNVHKQNNGRNVSKNRVNNNGRNGSAQTISNNRPKQNNSVMTSHMTNNESKHTTNIPLQHMNIEKDTNIWKEIRELIRDLITEDEWIELFLSLNELHLKEIYTMKKTGLSNEIIKNKLMKFKEIHDLQKELALTRPNIVVEKLGKKDMHLSIENIIEFWKEIRDLMNNDELMGKDTWMGLFVSLTDIEKYYIYQQKKENMSTQEIYDARRQKWYKKIRTPTVDYLYDILKDADVSGWSTILGDINLREDSEAKKKAIYAKLTGHEKIFESISKSTGSEKWEEILKSMNGNTKTKGDLVSSIINNEENNVILQNIEDYISKKEIEKLKQLSEESALKNAKAIRIQAKYNQIKENMKGQHSNVIMAEAEKLNALNIEIDSQKKELEFKYGSGKKLTKLLINAVNSKGSPLNKTEIKKIIDSTKAPLKSVPSEQTNQKTAQRKLDLAAINMLKQKLSIGKERLSMVKLKIECEEKHKENFFSFFRKSNCVPWKIVYKDSGTSERENVESLIEYRNTLEAEISINEKNLKEKVLAYNRRFGDSITWMISSNSPAVMSNNSLSNIDSIPSRNRVRRGGNRRKTRRAHRTRRTRKTRRH